MFDRMRAAFTASGGRRHRYTAAGLFAAFVFGVLIGAGGNSCAISHFGRSNVAGRGFIDRGRELERRSSALKEFARQGEEVLNAINSDQRCVDCGFPYSHCLCD